MGKSPTVSILMPVYNVQEYVAEAIDSILNQTFADFELILLDDCSADNTAKIISGFHDQRIVYNRNEKNLGLSENLNVGIRLARGKYLARMDGDDISLPTRLEKQVAMLDENPDIGICGTSYRFFGTRNETLIQPTDYERIKVQMLFGCCVTLVVMRKEIFLKNNLWYSSDAFPAEDYKMWADCLHVTKVCNVSEVLFLYRMHESQISTEKKVIQKQKSDSVRLEMLEWLSPDFTPAEKKYHCEQFIPGLIETHNDIETLYDFAELILMRNSMVGNFKANILEKRLNNHIKSAILMFSIKTCFAKGYGLKSYFMYLKSGLFLKISIKQNIKFVLKSIISK